MFYVGLVQSVEILSDKLKFLQVDLHREVLGMVSNAPNIKEGMLTIVALEGAEVEIEGEIITVAARVVGGRKSKGILLDSRMAGWGNTNKGLALVLPPEFIPGQEAPKSNPRSERSSAPAELSIKALKDLEKAKRKAELKAKREQKAALKADNSLA
jgi:hypothetical protein